MKTVTVTFLIAMVAASTIPEPLPHAEGPYLSPYSADGTLAPWVDEVIGRSSYDISGLASRLFQHAADAYGLRNPAELGGLLEAASARVDATPRDLGAAVDIVARRSARSGLDLDRIVKAVSELADHGIIGDSAGKRLERLLEAIDDPGSVLMEALGRRGIDPGDAGRVIGKLMDLPEADKEDIYAELDAESAPALRALLESGDWQDSLPGDDGLDPARSGDMGTLASLLARGHDELLSGSGEMLQRQLTDQVLRQGGGLGSGFMGLIDAMSDTHRRLDTTPELMAELRSTADISFLHIDDMLVHTMVNHRTKRDFARASEAMMILYPDTRPRMQAAHRVAREIILAEWHRMQQRMELDWESGGE